VPSTLFSPTTLDASAVALALLFFFASEATAAVAAPSADV
jgi:hypothetical protein